MRRTGWIVVALCVGFAQADQWTWDFNGDLAPRGDVGGLLTPFGTTSFETATIGGSTAQVARFLGPDGSFRVYTPITANGGGSYVNVYTLIMDVEFPSASWISLFQTNGYPDGNDGDGFVNPDQGLGISADYTDDGNPLRFTFDTWHRVAIVIDTTSPTGADCIYRCYIDGQLQNVVQTPDSWGVDGRFSMYPNGDATPWFYIFADDSGDAAAWGLVNSFQFRDYAMSAAEVAALGGPNADGIPGDPPNPPAPEIIVGPYLQSATPNSIWVAWESNSGDESRVDYGLTPALGSTAFGDAIPSVGSSRIHRAHITGLSPDTYYYYQASTEGGASEILHFRTPPDAAQEKSFRFVAASDMQRDNGNPNVWYEVVNEGIISFVTQNFGPDLSDELAFAINAGDLVDNGDSYSDWKNDFFDEAQNLYQFIPLYPAIGNHERDSHWYFDYLVLPENGTAGYLEHWYYVDYGNLRLIAMDSNPAYRIQEQLDWLDGVLADAGANPDIDFVFVELHHPYKSECWLPGEADYTGEAVRRLETFSSTYNKPSIHFFGHTHAYSRGQSKDHKHLWVNVASGEGNIDYWGEYAQADYPEYQISLPEWGFVLVEVDAGNNPKFRLRRISRGNEVVAKDNEVVDDITIRVNDISPVVPTGVYPTIADSPVSPDALSLIAEPFSDPDGDNHLESEFQVTATAGDYSDPIVDKWIRFENWYAPEGASGMSDGYYSVNTVDNPDITGVDVGSLLSNQTYYWRVRYRDDGLAWSAWSNEIMFTTGESEYGPNLLVNPGAEDDVNGWTVIDPPLESLADLDCASETSPVGGLRFFAVGGVCANEDDYGEAFQTVDVSAVASAIDAGRALANYSGYLKDYGGSDLPEIWIVFKNAGGAEISSTDKLGTYVSSWTLLQNTVAIPVQTRLIDFHMSGTRGAGTDNDSYLDNLALRVGITGCDADVDGDADTDLSDLAALLAAYGASSGDPNYNAGADFDNNGTVDLADLAYLLADYGCGN